MNERVYIETTFVSYLTAWPSRDVVIAAHQQITHQWWNFIGGVCGHGQWLPDR